MCKFDRCGEDAERLPGGYREVAEILILKRLSLSLSNYLSTAETTISRLVITAGVLFVPPLLMQGISPALEKKYTCPKQLANKKLNSGQKAPEGSYFYIIKFDAFGVWQASKIVCPRRGFVTADFYLKPKRESKKTLLQSTWQHRKHKKHKKLSKKWAPENHRNQYIRSPSEMRKFMVHQTSV